MATGLTVAVAFTGLLMGLRPAAPTLDRGAVTVDSVRFGDMVREVRGPGTLVAEHIRWIPAVVSARVDRLVAHVGQAVTPTTVIAELSNPDVDIQAMQAQQAYNDARAQLAASELGLQRGLLEQEAEVAAANTAHVVAAHRARGADSIFARGLMAAAERDGLKATAEEAAVRFRVAQRTLELLRASIEPQIAVQTQSVERLRQIAAFRESLKAAMVLRAGDAGTLQELSAGAGGPLLEPGQWVNAGMALAKVVQPGRLKAVVRIPETQAKDLAIGLGATVDTRNGVVSGHVSRIDPASSGGTVTVDIALDGPLPAGARPDLGVDGVIQVQKLPAVLYTGRPATGADGAVVGLFRLDEDGHTAQRVPVRLGVSSVNAVQVLAGLKAGDRVILSDMSQWDNTDRVRIR
ncbi:MAG: HlyD family efflux transporter periplasmic adaptor subunit [Gemmatimonadetes bacterium]|nr:HlyD family efflux transporter periplasmic adaptor subunit [Gemmatimonadota bacterium]